MIISLVPVSVSAVSIEDTEYWTIKNTNYYTAKEMKIGDYTLPSLCQPFGNSTNNIITKNAGQCDYVLVKQENYYYLIIYSGMVASVKLEENKITFLATSGYAYYGYYSASVDDISDGSATWSKGGVTSLGNGSIRTINYDDLQSVYYTTVDIPTTDGSQVVFPLTPWRMAVIALRGEQPRVMTIMKILALSGVGCLALLISLAVFGTVLKRYQGKL